MRKIALTSLAVAAATSLVVSYRVSEICAERGTTHRATQWLLTAIVGITATAAVAVLPRPRLRLRLVVAAIAGIAAAGGLVVFNVFVWLGSCD
jgi:hypothetical protein